MLNEEMMGEWFDSSIEPDKVTMEQFDKYVEEYLTIRAEADEVEKKLTELNKKMMAMSGKLIEFLEVQGKDKHITPAGSLTKVETKKWKAPEGDLRLPVIEYLKEKDQYDNVMAFNANKFHSWYQAEIEMNPEFTFNGVEQTSTKYLRFNKAKK